MVEAARKHINRGRRSGSREKNQGGKSVPTAESPPLPNFLHVLFSIWWMYLDGPLFDRIRNFASH